MSKASNLIGQRLGVAPGTIRYRNNKGLPLNKIFKNENN